MGVKNGLAGRSLAKCLIEWGVRLMSELEGCEWPQKTNHSEEERKLSLGGGRVERTL